MDNLEFEQAKVVCDQALRIDRHHAGALETRALLALEDSKPHEARQLLLRAVAAQPDEGYSKYMYLGMSHLTPILLTKLSSLLKYPMFSFRTN